MALIARVKVQWLERGELRTGVIDAYGCDTKGVPIFRVMDDVTGERVYLRKKLVTVLAVDAVEATQPHPDGREQGAQTSRDLGSQRSSG